MHELLLGIYPGVELLGHKRCAFPVLVDLSNSLTDWLFMLSKL